MVHAGWREFGAWPVSGLPVVLGGGTALIATGILVFLLDNCGGDVVH